MKKHAIASPSHAATWLACPNSLAAQIGQPEGDTSAADLGTAKHDLLNTCLKDGTDAKAYLGQAIDVGETQFVVDEDFARDVQTVIDSVRTRIENYRNLGCAVEILLSQDVPISHITGEESATGELDIALLVLWPEGHYSADVIDAKFGWTEVLAEENPQLMMYASGLMEAHDLLYGFYEFNLVIEQPARGTSEWTTTPDVIREFEKRAGKAASLALVIRDSYDMSLHPEQFHVTEKGCQWCKASAVCPARKAHVEALLGCTIEDFTVVDDSVSMLPVSELGNFFAQLETVEDWINAVRTRVEAEMLAGTKIPGLKLVAGKRGNRQWISDAEAEVMLKKFRIKSDEMYSKKLLGPKPILELLKDKPRQYKQIEALVTQAEGKPHVALDTDKRPALEIKPVDDGFELC